MPPRIDLSGQQFNHWIVLEPVIIPGRKGSALWKCQCDLCGQIYNVTAATLRNGTSRCCKKCSQIIDIVEWFKTHGNPHQIKVIERTERQNNSGEYYWHCICPVCKKDWYIIGSSLRHGSSKCIDCARLENLSKIKTPFFKDLTNQRFGKLVALEPTSKRLKTSVVWKCQCDCGNICYKASSYLINGDTKSCGCLTSYGETLIQKIFLENNIDFQKEKIVLINNSRLRFDFYLPEKNYFIEFDGPQHFDNGETTGYAASYEETHKRDLVKNTYCFENNIPLIRVPFEYKDILTLEDLMIETSSLILTKENENEYYKKYSK